MLKARNWFPHNGPFRPRFRPARGPAFAATVLAVVFLTGCFSSAPLEETSGDETPQGGFQIQGLRVRTYKGDELSTVLNAKKAEMNAEGDRIFLDSPFCLHYSTGTLSATMSADRGTLFLEDVPKYDISRNDFVLEGNTQFSNETMELTAPSVRYYVNNPDTTFVSGGGPFRLSMKQKGQDLRCTGSRLELDKTLKKKRVFDFEFWNNTDDPESPPTFSHKEKGA